MNSKIDTSRSLSMLVSVALVHLISGCGVSNKTTDSTQEQLKNNEVKVENKIATFGDLFTVAPAPGDYTHGIVVKISPKSADKSVNFEFQKPDGSWTIFSDSCIGGIDSTFNCYVVNESRKISLRPRIGLETGETFELNYKITPEQKNLTINSAQYDEQVTECTAQTDAGITKVKGRIKVSNPTTLGANKLGYIFFEFQNAANIGQTLTILNSSNNGFEIKGDGDNAPWIVTTFYPGRSSSAPNDNCKVSLLEFTPGGKVKGDLECNLTQSSFDTPSVIGTNFTLPKSEWICDKWIDSFL
jgi:hypothetical protein